MKKFVLLIVISLMLCSISFSQSQSTLESDPLLKESWMTFKSALKKSDLNTLKILCADSVKFSMYMGNHEMLASETPELSESDYDKKNLYTNYFYMPQESFVTEELPYVFDSNVINRMDDQSMLRIVKTNGGDSEYQILITIADPDEEFAGTEMGVRFKKEKGTFLLCGIDTIQ
jgi:hypothetical protein